MRMPVLMLRQPVSKPDFVQYTSATRHVSEGLKQLLCPLLFLHLLASATYGQHIIAHRGSSFAAPENTLAAFRLAWREGADGIEGDFFLSADGRIVCVHDKDTKRVAGKKLVVEKSTFSQLRNLDVGAWKDPKWKGEKIPTLEEVLATVPRGKLMFIELKSGPKIVEPLAKALAISMVPTENIVIISFNASTIEACEKRMPHLKSYWLTGYKKNKQTGKWEPSADEVAEKIRRIGADGLGSNALQSHVDRGFLSQLKSQGVNDFHVWTVDDPRIARVYQRFGTWSITTNRPALIRKGVLDQTNEQKKISHTRNNQ